MSVGWIIFFGLFVFIISVVTWDKRNRVKAECVHCQSTQVVETARNTLGSRTVQLMDGGLKSGSDVRVQRDVEIMYSCQACGKTFSHRTTQTS